MSAPSSGGTRRFAFALPAAAALLGAALVAVAATAARALAENDRLVREGILLRLGSEIAAELRFAGPDDADAVLADLGATSADVLAGAEVLVGGEQVARWGRVGPDAVEMPAALGPAWRGAAAGEGGQRRMRGGEGPGHPPFRLRLEPSPRLHPTRRTGPLVLGGSVAASLALVALAFLVARGVNRKRQLAVAHAESARLQTVARAGAGLAHRIGNPLAAIKGTAQMLAATSDAQVRDRSGRIVAASERIEDLVRQLLRFARPVEPNPSRLDLRAVARALAPGLGDGVQVLVPEGSGAAALADGDQVIAILEELLANAKAAGAAEIEIADGADGSVAWIEIRDHGPGLALDAEQAFEPYVTTRENGTGLGLPIVRSLARANGGDVRLFPREGGGVVARVELPAPEA